MDTRAAGVGRAVLAGLPLVVTSPVGGALGARLHEEPRRASANQRERPWVIANGPRKALRRAPRLFDHAARRLSDLFCHVRYPPDCRVPHRVLGLLGEMRRTEPFLYFRQRLLQLTLRV